MNLVSTGSWSTTINSADLISGAGSDLQSTHEGLAGDVQTDISATTGSTDTWRVDVRRTDTNWDANVRVWVRRTGDGTGPGSISGGAAYQEITSTDATLFTGAGDRTAVDLQVKITSMSLGVSVDNYSSSITYTVVDT